MILRFEAQQDGCQSETLNPTRQMAQQLRQRPVGQLPEGNTRIETFVGLQHFTLDDL